MPMSREIGARLNRPTTAKSFVPNWYKKSDAFIGGKMRISDNGINKDIKLCVPFLDAMTAGYCVELSCDVDVSRDENGVNFYWHEEPFPMDSRPSGLASKLPRPQGFSETLYAWKIHWASITPPGYSALFCHPLNRYDLPFFTTAGIVDTDSYSPGGEIPFFLSSSFEGVIPCGTPIVQIIPFKREAWDSELLDHSEDFISRARYSVLRVLTGGYAKFFWNKKTYR